jgi:hypothetical protein
MIDDTGLSFLVSEGLILCSRLKELRSDTLLIPFRHSVSNRSGAYFFSLRNLGITTIGVKALLENGLARCSCLETIK